MKNSPIGIFDSGIGGLTVTKEIIKKLPKESIIYLGDTARVPYGTRSKEVITKFALELADVLLKKNVKFLVVACNTISSTCLSEIEKISPVSVLGVIEPTIKEAVRITKNNKIGVIGTNGTINSGIYEKKIKLLNPKIEVVSAACPLFVPLAEEGLVFHKATRLIAEDYLRPLKDKKVDTLILGCTHYPVLVEVIQSVMGEEVALVDSAKPTAEILEKILKEEKLLSENNAKYEFYVTDAPKRVLKVASLFFGNVLDGNLKQITLPTL